MAYKFIRSLSRTLRCSGTCPRQCYGMSEPIKGEHALQISTFHAKFSPSNTVTGVDGVSETHIESRNESENNDYSRKTSSEDDDLEVDLVDSSIDGGNCSSDLDDYSDGAAAIQTARSQGVYKAILLGEVGLGPSQKMMRSGHAVTWFSLATGGMRNNRRPFDTETPEEYAQRSVVQWHRVAIYQDRVGMMAMKSLRKGSQVYVEGNMETRIFYDPQSNVVKRIKEIAIRRNGRILFLDQSRNAGAMNDKKFR